MKAVLLNILIFSALLSLFLLPRFDIHAITEGGQPGGPTEGGQGFTLRNPIQANTFSQIMQRVADIVVLIALPIVVIMIIWSGFLFVTAQGDEKKITTAKSTLWWAVIGALLVVGAKAISLAIENFARQL